MIPTGSKRPACRSRFKIPKRGSRKIAYLQFLMCIGVVASDSTSQYDICTSQECNDTASTILKNMDPNVQPCIDFYKFACGGFVEKAIIPTYEKSHDMFDVTKDKIYVALKDFFETDIESNELKSFVLIKKFYKSCVNTEAIKANGYEPLREILRKLGGWPLVVGNTWNESNFDWRTSMSEFRKIGDNANYFIHYKIERDEVDRTKRVIVLSRPPTSFGYKFQYYGVSNATSSTIMSIVTEILGAEGHDIELSDTYAFETRLYNIIKSVDESSDANIRNRMTIAELSATYTDVQWKDYINSILPSGVRVDDNEIIIVEGPSYFVKLISLMSETPKRLQANYVFRKFVHSATDLISAPDNPLLKPRWQRCVDIVKKKLPLIVDAVYVRGHFPYQVRSNIEDMFLEIWREMYDELSQASWMNEETRNATIEKLVWMKFRVGYAEELLNDKSLEEYHANLTFTENNYFGNMFNMTSFVRNDALKNLRKSITRDDWGDDKGMFGVSAYYEWDRNAVRIDAGILRDIFYGKDRPDYLNYGAIGTIIGHEMGHGFGVNSNGYDKLGNIRDYWDSTTKQKYHERVGCIIEQYSNFMLDKIGLQVNATQPQNEMIADNIGIRLAYETYIWKTAAKLEWSTVVEPRLKGLEKYSPRQMFWISAANHWCSRATDEYLWKQVNEDVHPIAEYRVIGPLSNMEEFANDFECSKVLNLTSHSRMIPKKRCSLFKSSNLRG